jgi:hypothetical protein
MRQLELVATVLLAAGCGTQPICGPTNCDGCCDASGTCQAGTTTVACGAQGSTCEACSGASCFAGACIPAGGSGGGGGGGSSGVGGGNTAVGGGGATGGGHADAGNSDLVCSGNPTPVTLTELYPVLFGGECLTCHYPAGYMGMTVEGTGGAYGDYSTLMKAAGMIGQKSVYAGAAGTLKIVDPNHLENSTLWLKLASPGPVGYPGPHGENTNAHMPNDGTTLMPGVLQQVKDWICTGAPQ